ncbi:hypothetical protein OSB04_027376 [Centaurea solstitialis]|uniref:Receptor-like serine/threonine-protein kinase n=1 Tax=Centaurea solstitialis TaxID=347529 RepID=A0AA38SDR4_9ASTR|nr:hypothetical protein OSB04_027376 [Centaurea solstitialis]
MSINCKTKIKKMTWIYYFILITIRVASASARDTIFPNQTLKDGDTIVSASGVFELGFFGIGHSRSRYLGIRYKIIPTADVVWVANRKAPLVDPTGMLKVNGTLQLLSVGNSLIWSAEPVTNTSTSTVLVAQLLDSGNLVLKDDASGKFFWQSFDHPGNTWLPGMKIGEDRVRGIKTNLTSWKNSHDPSAGSYTLWMDMKGYPQLYIMQVNLSFQQRVGYWNGLGFTGMSRLDPSSFYTFDFVFTDNEIYLRYTPVNQTVFTRMTLDQVGRFQLLVWINETKSWGVYMTTFKDPCNTYNPCGPYGSCNANASKACVCLKGFKPKQHKEWSLGDWSNGCERENTTTAKNGEFIKTSNLKLPDSWDSWFRDNMTLAECQNVCNSNLSCMAYANIDVRNGGNGCLQWSDELIDIKEAQPGDNSGQDIYVSMRNPYTTRYKKKEKKKKKKLSLKVILLTVLPVLLSSFALILYAWRTKKKSHLKDVAFANEDQRQDMELPLFSFSEIVKATSEFSIHNKLGQGGFGAVYKGVLEGGEIAVKRLSKTSSQGLAEFQNEVICIAKLQHRNLVKLLGYCIQGDEKMLVYEYMPNKSLDFFLFDKDNPVLLDWPQRYHIINGIARGLVYLHQDSRLRIIHRDLKASNILLDSRMNPKISDFGLARMCREHETEANTNKVVGTLGYISPEYAAGGVFSVKSDVFSFGVLVLEIVSGKKNRGFFHQDQHDTLLGHAWRLYKEAKLLELVDAALEDSWNVSEVLQSLNVGLSCVQQHPEDRPSMSTVIHMLGGEDALPPPKQPRFFSDETESDGESTTLLMPKLPVSIN